MHLFIFISRSIACQIAGVQLETFEDDVWQIKEKYPVFDRDFTFTSFWWPHPGLLLLLIWTIRYCLSEFSERDSVNSFYQMTSTSISSARVVSQAYSPDSFSFPGGTSGKELACQCRTTKRFLFNPWVRKIPWRRSGNPLQYSCLKNPMDREAWQATVHRVAKSWAWLKWLSTAWLVC